MITHEDWQKALGLKQTAAIRRHLTKARIPFREIAGKICTTEEALTSALIGRAKPKKGPNFDAIAAESPRKTR
jgi:hypothetical protein